MDLSVGANPCPAPADQSLPASATKKQSGVGSRASASGSLVAAVGDDPHVFGFFHLGEAGVL